MVKRALVTVLGLLAGWSCSTFKPVPSAFHIEDIPQEVSTRLTLDQRLAAGEIWKSLREGRADQARKLLARLGPESPVYAAGRGYASLVTADFTAAEQDFKASLQAFPDQALANIGLAQIYEALGRRDLAFAQYREILQKDPGNRWAKPRFGALRERFVEESANEARAALALGDREKAKKAFNTVLFYAPDSAEAHLELARLYRQEKNTAGSLLHYRAVVEARPDDKTLLREYADLLYESQELGLSLDLYEKLSAIDPKDKTTAARVEELKGKLGVYELPSQYASLPAVEALTREDLAALIAVKFKDLLGASGRRTEILVDISTSWAQKFIVEVASQGVMSIFDNHTFQPRRVINRAEFAETVSRLVEFLKDRGTKFVPVIEPRRIQVGDVSPDNYYYQPILRVVSLQVMELTPQRMFEPERTVSGREALRVLEVVRGLAK